MHILRQKWIFALVACAIFLCSGCVAAAGHQAKKGADFGGFDFAAFRRSIPTLTKSFGTNTKKKECQSQLQKVQDMVLKDPESALESRERINEVFCILTRECLEEIIKVFNKNVVGGRKSISDLIHKTFGFSLPDDVELSLLVLMYYDSICKPVKGQAEEAHEEKDIDDLLGATEL